jgi:hypothetical protein
MRDVNYMCEAVTRESTSWWTINDGYCLPYPLAYRTLNLDSTVVNDNCTFSLKCALSNGLDQDCECESATACRSVVNNSCTNKQLFYPKSGSIITPYVGMVYGHNRDWTNKRPDWIQLNGQVKCIGYQLITNGSGLYKIDESFQFYRYLASENILCNMQDGNKNTRNYTGPHYDANCWNDSKTFNNRSYQVSFLCKTKCISKYRVRDGIRDCFENEEAQTINNSCPQIQHHRLQCSSSQPTCFLVGVLGDWLPSCSNGRDEFDDESGTISLTSIVCAKNTDLGCVYLRKYIRSSSENNTAKLLLLIILFLMMIQQQFHLDHIVIHFSTQNQRLMNQQNCVNNGFV